MAATCHVNNGLQVNTILAERRVAIGQGSCRMGVPRVQPSRVSDRRGRCQGLPVFCGRDDAALIGIDLDVEDRAAIDYFDFIQPAKLD